LKIHSSRLIRISSSTKKAGVISERGWSRAFDDPIPLPGGEKLFTLRSRRHTSPASRRRKAALPEWHTAIQALILTDHGSPTMLAPIGVMRALNRHVEPVLNPDRKDHHWGKPVAVSAMYGGNPPPHIARLLDKQMDAFAAVAPIIFAPFKALAGNEQPGKK
jgi:hypothetical protein